MKELKLLQQCYLVLNLSLRFLRHCIDVLFCDTPSCAFGFACSKKSHGQNGTQSFKVCQLSDAFFRVSPLCLGALRWEL
eukprot:2601061-Amphidinium_carterae.1